MGVPQAFWAIASKSIGSDFYMNKWPLINNTHVSRRIFGYAVEVQAVTNGLWAIGTVTRFRGRRRRLRRRRRHGRDRRSTLHGVNISRDLSRTPAIADRWTGHSGPKPHDATLSDLETWQGSDWQYPTVRPSPETHVIQFPTYRNKVESVL